MLTDLSILRSRQELTESLAGLETGPSNHVVNETDDLKKPRSRSSARGPHIFTHVRYSTDANEVLMSSNRQRSPREYVHHAAPHSHDSDVAALHSFTDSEPGGEIPVPNSSLVPDAWRQSETKLRRSINTSPVDERFSLSSPISANPTSWHERGIPYISSMRRASSSSSMRVQYNRHAARDEDMPSTRPSLRPPESAVRYDDTGRYNDRGIHSDDRVYLSTVRYTTQAHQRHGPYQSPRGSLDGEQRRYVLASSSR